MKNKLIIAALFHFALSGTIHAQIGIGTSLPDSNALLELNSTTKGFLLPRMTTIQQKDIADPPVGLIVFNLDSTDIYFFDGVQWLSARDLSDTIFLWRCGDPFTDQRNGKIYPSALIGTQCWMAKNLNAGTMITGSAWPSNNGELEKNCYNDIESNCDTYGGMYTWDEMMQYSTTEGVQGICPDGWYLPTNGDWTTLTTYLGGESVAGGKLKSTGTIEAGTGLWYAPNFGADNSSGLTAHPGGWRTDYFVFYDLGNYGYFWTSTQSDQNWKYDRLLQYYTKDIISLTAYYSNVFSVRCIRTD